MRRVFAVICLISIVFCSCKYEQEKKLKYYKSKYANVYIDDWSRINLQNAIIENNVWGKEYARNNFQIIFSNTAGTEFGWFWKYAYTTKRISSTPVLIVGKKPWFDTTSNILMPIQISSIDSFYCHFEYNSKAIGNYENSLGLWITNSKRSNNTDIVFQLVCVFGDVGTDKLGTFIKTIQMGEIKMDEYFFDNKEMPFKMLIFYLHSKASSLQFNIKEYSKYLVLQKYISETDYISSLELATSIKWGEGETVFKNFNCIINSK